MKEVHNQDYKIMTEFDEKFQDKIKGSHLYKVYDPMTGHIFISDGDNKVKPVPMPMQPEKDCSEMLV